MITSDAMKNEWQPISTAPKINGKWILLFGNGDGFEKCHCIGWWADRAQSFVDWNCFPMTPTHWMHLPNPPKDE